MEKSQENKIADFLFEIGTMRKLPRMHQQMFLTQDLSDNIATHSYRVAMIAWFLAKMEKADPYKTVMMAMLHDAGEIRSGDHNYVHKKYIKVYEKEIAEDQFGNLPFDDFLEMNKEYEKRESKEAIVAKDADLIDQILLLKEYVQQGNTEAQTWLRGKGSLNKNIQYKNLKTVSGKKLGREIIYCKVSRWWENIWTSKNR